MRPCLLQHRLGTLDAERDSALCVLHSRFQDVAQAEIDRRHDQIYGSILHSKTLDIGFVRAVFRSVSYNPRARYANAIEMEKDLVQSAPPVVRRRPAEIELGTATDTNFFKYVLEYAPTGTTTFTVLTTGTTPVTDGVRTFAEWSAEFDAPAGSVSRRSGSGSRARDTWFQTEGNASPPWGTLFQLAGNSFRRWGNASRRRGRLFLRWGIASRWSARSSRSASEREDSPAAGSSE